jgi:hypothetical protein
MVNKLYCTPLYWPEHLIQDSIWHSREIKRAQNFVEGYFQWCNREVAIVENQDAFGDIRVNLEERTLIWWQTLVKVVSCATLIIPAILFIARTILRHRCTLVVNFQTKNFTDSQATGRFHPLSPEILCEGVKRDKWGRVDTIKSREADFSWTGSRKHLNGDQEIGYFNSLSTLITGTKITQNSIEYIHTKPLIYVIRDNTMIAFARVWLNPDNCQMRAIQQTMRDSYEPYSGSVYEALTLTANENSFVTVLEQLTDEDYFDPKQFLIYLTTPDAQGALPALGLHSDALEVLINHFKQACAALDVARKDTSKEHWGESLFSYWMKWSKLSTVSLLLKYCYPACMRQIQERAITFFVTPGDSLEPLMLAIENEDPPSCYNLGNLLDTIELTNKEKRLALHCVPGPTLLKLCELYQKGRVVFEQTSVTKAQFLTFVDPCSKENLLTLWIKKGDIAVLKALLSIDSAAIKQHPQIPYFSIAVDSGHKAAAEVLLDEMQNQNIPLSPIEIWFKKIKETRTPLQMTPIDKQLMTPAELVMLLRAGRLYQQKAFTQQLRQSYNVANSDRLPTVIWQKVLSFVGYSGARVSCQFRLWTYTGATKEIGENVLARLLPKEVFTTLCPAFSKLGTKFYRSYLKNYYHLNHTPALFFAQLEFIRDRFKAAGLKDEERFLSKTIEELPSQVKPLNDDFDAIA